MDWFQKKRVFLCRCPLWPIPVKIQFAELSRRLECNEQLWLHKQAWYLIHAKGHVQLASDWIKQNISFWGDGPNRTVWIRTIKMFNIFETFPTLGGCMILPKAQSKGNAADTPRCLSRSGINRQVIGKNAPTPKPARFWKSQNDHPWLGWVGH